MRKSISLLKESLYYYHAFLQTRAASKEQGFRWPYKKSQIIIELCILKERSQYISFMQHEPSESLNPERVTFSLQIYMT